ncbi:uncharacterized protein EV420DRAFT_1749137 [Desarmillaria tabescens]|uniref:Uncharacterized protein n=1 Tax=Armillaria tabescens TaxID=1929756 RepID=A0AA39N2E9_ARMTA|nr:uncharacterized protein EV420DRAFT_1749137 [Desarmillaria tabescens]KAK0455716.1 hypothetical protein EV420DRAFT_1749137 [Desarmillaria tabescens]
MLCSLRYPNMPGIFKKMFIKFLYPIALIIGKYPWHIYVVFVLSFSLWSRNIEQIALGCFVGAVFPGSWTIITMQEDQDNKRAAALKKVEQQFIEFNTYIDNQRASCQVDTRESDAYQLCSLTVTQQCLVSKQIAEALYSAERALAARVSPRWTDLDRITTGLGTQERRVQAIVENYLAFRSTLPFTAPHDQLDAAQQWVAQVNAAYPPIAADPVDESFL